MVYCKQKAPKGHDCLLRQEGAYEKIGFAMHDFVFALGCFDILPRKRKDKRINANDNRRENKRRRRDKRIDANNNRRKLNRNGIFVNNRYS